MSNKEIIEAVSKLSVSTVALVLLGMMIWLQNNALEARIVAERELGNALKEVAQVVTSRVEALERRVDTLEQRNRDG